MTSPETSEAEISAAKPSVCLAHRSGFLCRPDEMKICIVCTEWTRAALTAAAQVRAQADLVRAQGEKIDREITDEQRRMCDELHAQLARTEAALDQEFNNGIALAAALGIRKGE